MKHVALIAPSFPFPKSEFASAVDYLKAEGFTVTAPSNTLGPDLLCANTDDIRLKHLQNALIDPSIDIIWAAGGGYGMTRILPSLFAMQKPEKEKIFIGYSDGTPLHLFLNQVWDWPSIHGAVTRQLSEKRVGQQTIEGTLRTLREGINAITLPSLIPWNTAAKRLESLQGKVIGGNLCLVECSLGTPWHIHTAGKILFLEDAWERGYSIDRMLVHLQQARVFDEVKAIILGDFVKGNEADGTSLISPVLERFSQSLNIPVFSLPGYGHGHENLPLPFNTEISFDIADSQ